MKTITISLADSANDETVQAEYFQIEDGWVTFKTEAGKTVSAYPEKRITRIKSEEQAPTVVFNVSGLPREEDVERIAKNSVENAARWGTRS